MDVVRLHQAGISYAVATLGTATTPEHLKRIFRLVNEVVFAFDGDRAGRAAAWRALQHTLPEAREGREIRFLFLPEGQDPDSLVGAEGREDFEKRLAAALPLSEYLVREVSSGHRSVACRRPRTLCRSRAPAGRRSCAGRVSRARPRADRLRPSRSPRRGCRSCGAASAGARCRPRRRSALSRAAASAPGAAVSCARRFAGWCSSRRLAARVSAPERADLDRCTSPASKYCASSSTICKRTPAQISAQVIERWADRPERESLEKLLQKEEVITECTRRRGRIARRARQTGRACETPSACRSLSLRAGSTTLDDPELQEFQRLTTKGRAPARRPAESDALAGRCASNTIAGFALAPLVPPRHGTHIGEY